MSNGISWANLVKNSTPVETKNQNIETNRFDDVYHLNDDADYYDWEDFNNNLGFSNNTSRNDIIFSLNTFSETPNQNI